MSADTTLLAKGANYFEDAQFPLTIKRVRYTDSDKSAHPKNLTEIRHQHDFCELAIIARGQSMHWLGGLELPIAAGDVFMLQAQQDHYFFDIDDLEIINVMYQPRRLPLPESQLQQLPGYSALFLLEPRFRKQHKFSSRLTLNRSRLAVAERIAGDMEREVRQKTEGYQAAVYCKWIELIVFLSRCYNERQTPNGEALLRVAKVIARMEKDYADDWKMEDFSDIAHLSRSHLIRTFKKATGQAPFDYLTDLRLQKAMTQLRESELTISEIAFEVGFNDSNYFTRQFRKRQDTTPLAYRKKHR